VSRRAILFCAAVSLGAAGARADSPADDPQRASDLFRRGRTALAAGELAAACPALEESQRLDPSGGTLLNLALCHERAGQLSRAQTEFVAAAAVARREGRGDRETEATSRAQAILARLAVGPAPAAKPSRQWRSALTLGIAGLLGVGLLIFVRARNDARRRRTQNGTGI
jgi:tetratricopeptide (TPR) repeat protein